MAIALGHTNSGSGAPAHDHRENGERYAIFQHARAARVPEIMEPALNLGANLCDFPGFLPAAYGLRWVRMVGACREIVTSSPVTLGWEHVVRGPAVREVACPELQNGRGTCVERKNSSGSKIGLALSHGEGT